MIPAEGQAYEHNDLPALYFMQTDHEKTARTCVMENQQKYELLYSATAPMDLPGVTEGNMLTLRI